MVPDEPTAPEAVDFADLWKWQDLRKRDTNTHRGHAAAWARSVLEAAENWLFVDTETTGLSRSDQVIELAVAAPVKALGRWRLEPVLVQRMRPSVPIDPGASMVHGIYERHLRDSPTFRELADQIRTVLHGRRLLAWNAPFDRAALRRTVDSWQTCTVAEDHDWYCAMRAHAVWAGDTGGRMLYRYHKLGGDRAKAPRALAESRSHDKQWRMVFLGRRAIRVISTSADLRIAERLSAGRREV